MEYQNRILRYADGSGYGLWQVILNEDGTFSVGAAVGYITADSPDELAASMKAAVDEAMRSPIVDEPDWTGEQDGRILGG